jgi:hypothetical protein
MEKSVGNLDLIVCNDCVHNLVTTSKDICNTCPDTALEIIITMLINKCGNVCSQKLAVKNQRIEELKDFKERMSPGAIR